MKPEERHVEGLKRFELASTADWEQRELAVEDLLFIHAEDGQWSEEISTKRKDRPRYTIDRISPAIEQIVGNQRQTRTSIKVHPKKDGTKKTAETYTGLVRGIEQNSNSNSVYDVGFDEQITSGFGGWRVLTDYESDETFDQIISLAPINSAASSLYFDPTAEKYDKRDSGWGFLVSHMLVETFKEEYPDRMVTDFSVDQYTKGNAQQWFRGETLRIAEYWYKIAIKKEIALMTDGRVIDLEEEEAVIDELAEEGITVKKTRTVDSIKVEMVIMNGAEILTKPQEWAGKFIPLVPVFGRTATINGKTYVRGVVRKAKDPQRIYNYATSAAIESSALTPKDPYFQTPDMIKGHVQQWNNFNADNPPTMLYNADPTVAGPPQRGGAPQVQQALLMQIEQAKVDIHATTGIEPASMGNVPLVKSGKALRAEDEKGDRGSYVFVSNLEKSLQYTGEIIIDLISKIYDTERIEKVIGIDGKEEDVSLNELQWNGVNDPMIDEETGEQVIVNDLSQGSYSVTVKTAPSYATKQEETVNQLARLTEEAPDLRMLVLDIAVDNMNLNNGEEIKKRVRKLMIDQGVVDPTEEEKEEFGLDQPPPTDPMQEALVDNLEAQSDKLMVDIEKVISDIRNKDADTQSKILSAQKDSISALTDMVASLIKKRESGIPITEDDLDIMKGQQVLVQETIEDVLENQEIGGSLPMDAKGQPIQGQPPVQGQLNLSPDQGETQL